MHTKLTLRLEDQLIEAAKAHALASGRSISQMVAEYFLLLGSPSVTKTSPQPLAPRVAKLKGVLKGTAADREDYRGYLDTKCL